MPKATSHLRAKFDSDAAAFAVLGDNFTNMHGVISPRAGYKPTDADHDAIDYLFQEWDYGYEPRPA
jgi:hypothetical protein